MDALPTVCWQEGSSWNVLKAPVHGFWVSRMGLLGCTFRDRGQDLAGFQGLQAACGGSEEHDTTIMARKGMAREKTRAGGWGGNSRRDGQMAVPGPHVSPSLPVVECTANTLWRSTV